MDPLLVKILSHTITLFLATTLVGGITLWLVSDIKSDVFSLKSFLSHWLVVMLLPTCICLWMAASESEGVKRASEFLEQWRKHNGTIYFDPARKSFKLVYKEQKILDGKTLSPERSLSIPQEELGSEDSLQKWQDSLPKVSKIREFYTAGVLISMVISCIVAIFMHHLLFPKHST